MDLSQLFGFSPICFKIFLSDRSNNGAKIFIGLNMDPQVSKWMHLSSSILRNFMMQTLVDVIIPTYTSNSERHVQLWCFCLEGPDQFELILSYKKKNTYLVFDESILFSCWIIDSNIEKKYFVAFRKNLQLSRFCLEGLHQFELILSYKKKKIHTFFDESFLVGQLIQNSE